MKYFMICKDSRTVPENSVIKFPARTVLFDLLNLSTVQPRDLSNL